MKKIKNFLAYNFSKRKVCCIVVHEKKIKTNKEVISLDVTLRHLRIRVRKTQAEVSKKLGYSSVYSYQRLETGQTKRTISKEVVSALAEMFQVTEKEVQEAIQTTKEIADRGILLDNRRASLPRNRHSKKELRR